MCVFLVCVRLGEGWRKNWRERDGEKSVLDSVLSCWMESGFELVCCMCVLGVSEGGGEAGERVFDERVEKEGVSLK